MLRTALSFCLACLLPVAASCGGPPPPLDPSLGPEEVVAQFLEDAERLLLVHVEELREALRELAGLPAPVPMDLVPGLQPTLEEFRPFADRALLSLSHPSAAPPGLLGSDLATSILVDLALRPGVLLFEPGSAEGAWVLACRLRSVKRDVAPPEAVVDAEFLDPRSGQSVAGAHYHLLETELGWRISDGGLLSPSEERFDNRFDLEAIPDQPAWRIRRVGDDLPTKSVRRITLDAGLQLRTRDGPALPATPEQITSWLEEDPAAVDFLLTPADGCTIQDLYHAIDALFAAGVTHLSLVTTPP